LVDRSFDPRRAIELESPPNPVPVDAPDPAGTVRVVGETTDELEIAVDLSRPQVLLITDAYSAGWRAEPMEGSVQSRYEILPGDYCLRAIPLAAGHQHLRLEYRPGAVVTGMILSVSSVIVYCVFCAIAIRSFFTCSQRGTSV
jgi:uncharacterized membrane protein YfhO